MRTPVLHGSGLREALRRLLACAAVCSALGAPGLAGAQGAEGAPSPGGAPADAAPQKAPAPVHSPADIQAARQTAVDGLAAYKAGDYDKALQLFEQARALYPSAQILRMLGYSHIALQRWGAAVETLDLALASEIGPLPQGDRMDVQEQLTKALGHFGTVMIASPVAGSVLRVDDQPPRKLPLIEPIRLLEGAHRLVVSAPGHHDAEQEVALKGGEALDLVLEPTSIAAPPPPKPKPRPKPKPAPPPEKPWAGVRLFPGQREAGLAAAGSGILLGGAALVTALAGADLRGQVEEDAQRHEQSFGPSCDRGGYRLCVFDRAVINRDADRADGLRDASVWLGVGGAVLVAGGAALFLLAPDGPLVKGAGAPKTGAAPPETAPGGRGRATLRARRPPPAVPPPPACGPLAAGLTCAGSF